MKNLFLSLSFLFFCVNLQAQIGIGNTDPKATLDITGQPTVTTELDGVIAPRITGAQLRAKTYTTAQTAALVFVTVADTAPAGQTIDVTIPGYYYFDGTKWTLVAPSNDWKITGNSNTTAGTNFLGTTNDVNLIFKRNNIQAGLLTAPATSNTGFGVSSLSDPLLSGIFNTGIGDGALRLNTTGHRNTGVGSGALGGDNATAVTGYQNTALGRYTMHFITTGYNNMAIGQEAAKWNSTGHDNVAIGFNALRQNGTGSYNIAIGRSANAVLVGGDIINNVGNNNIVIGSGASLPVTTDSNQMVLGGGPGTAVGLDATVTTKTIINGIVNAAAGAPASSSATGVVGELRVATVSGTAYLYICTATNTWRRVALSTF